MVYQILIELSVAMLMISFIARFGRTSVAKLNIEKANRIRKYRVERNKMERMAMCRDLMLLKARGSNEVKYSY